jgi:hypothetical protein
MMAAIGATMRLIASLVSFLAVGMSLIGSPALAQSQPGSEPRYWRGNLHTHTYWSDGNDYPEMVAEWYAKNGYNFLAISDHNVMQQGTVYKKVADLEKRARGKAFAKYLARFGPDWVQTRGTGDAMEVRLKPFDEYRTLFEVPGQFLMMPAEEITGEADNKRAIHINATNLLELIEPPKGANVVDVIKQTTDAVHAQAARFGREILVHVNHPNYKWGVTAEDLAAISSERFFEIWNGVDSDGDPGDEVYPSTDEIWDIANTLRIAGFGAPPLLGLATDDSHDYHGDVIRAMPGRAWVMVRAKFLTPEHLILAIREGDFYASSGVTLERVTFDEASGRLSLQIMPEDGERYVTRFVGTRKGANIVGTPRKNAEGKIVETTLDYTTAEGPQIGEVFAEVEGVQPSYTLGGDELYVRAIVISTGIPTFPTKESQQKKAWTQPVGWRPHVK